MTNSQLFTASPRYQIPTKMKLDLFGKIDEIIFYKNPRNS